MSQVTYRGNLSAKQFPFISQDFGQSVVVPQQDNNFNRQLVSSEDSDKDIGLPQLLYCHNVIPTAQGFQSVGFIGVLSNSVPNTLTAANGIFQVRDSGANRGYVATVDAGSLYFLNGTVWQLLLSYPSTSIVTFGYINGKTYIYVSGIGCFYFDFPTQSLIAVTLIGLTITGPGSIIGIMATAGYIIAWSNATVFWSSTINELDFTPSLITGAGSGSPQGAKGDITYCVPHQLGFIVYTVVNAIAGLYSGNARFPFNFREIVSTGGLSTLDYVGFDANSSNHYAYTTSGLQLISTSGSQTVYPELTDFLGGKYFEDFDDGTRTFSYVLLSATMKKKLSVIADRYLCISYGITALTHVIVYDLIMKRYGKLKWNHVAVFQYTLPSAQITEAPRQSFGLLDSSGNIAVVDFSQGTTNTNGTMILGKYQYIRARFLTLDEITLQNTTPAQNLVCNVLASFDGQTLQSPALAQLTLSNPTLKRWNGQFAGRNHSILFQGGFYASSLELVFHIGGKY